ncbi:MAG: GNAT family N-acetyltransferase [Bacteroidota bacterium]
MHFPILTTPRLLLRQLAETDDAAIFSLRSNDRVNRFLQRPKQHAIEEAASFIKKINDAVNEGNSFYWGITVKDEPGLIGTICLWNISADRKTVELGYELHPDQQGKGYMNEAIKAVIDYAFQTGGFSNLEAYTHKDNEASTKLLLKHQFVLQSGHSDPENANLHIYLLQKL